MPRESVATYRAGETFTCTRRAFDPTKADAVGDACGATVRMHDAFWCAQVCPSCLAIYWAGHGLDTGVYPDFGAFYPADTAVKIRASIAANGGQYVPTF